MPFYFKINKIKIIDNKESGFLFFHKDLATITFESFFADSEKTINKCDKYKMYLSAKDEKAKEVAIAEMVVDAVKRRQTIKVDSVKDNQILTFGDTGCTLYRSGTIPDNIGWCLMGTESDQDIRNVGMSIEAVLKHPNFKTFASAFSGLVNLSKNPAFSASMAVLKYIGECVASSMKNNQDDMVGLLYTSFNRWEHYPNGERKAEDVLDLTGNMMVDYSIFGFTD